MSNTQEHTPRVVVHSDSSISVLGTAHTKDPHPWRVEVIDRNDMEHIAAREGDRLASPHWRAFWDVDTERLVYSPRPEFDTAD